MGQMKLNAFQRLLDEFNQAVNLGGETRGLAAWLADIKGSVWELGYTKPGTPAPPVKGAPPPPLTKTAYPFDPDEY
jgi:hypothetical protein